MKVVIVWLKWLCNPYPKYYSESPNIDINRVMIEMAALKATRGKVGFAGARPIRHTCKVCGRVFWTERKQEATCKLWRCYRAYNLGK